MKLSLNYLRTSAAAKYCADVLGRPMSPGTLRKFRLKGSEDPGEQGPRWVRDPQSGHCLYSVDGLVEWVRNWESELTPVRISRAIRQIDRLERLKPPPRHPKPMEIASRDPLPGTGESDAILLRFPQVQRAAGNLSRATIYRMVKAGTFPAPIKLGARASAWRWGELREWLESRTNVARK